jgi:hypothetical protein
MLGHLVFGRYSAEDVQESHATRERIGWIERLLVALRRRRSHQQQF